MGHCRLQEQEKCFARAREDDFRDEAGRGGMQCARRGGAHERLKWAPRRAARARAARRRLSNSEGALFWPHVNGD